MLIKLDICLRFVNAGDLPSMGYSLQKKQPLIV